MNTTKHSAPAFQVYPSHELSDLYGISPAAHGVYARLRCHCWLRRGLPTSPRALAKLAGVPIGSFARLWSEIREHFTRRGARLLLPNLLALQQEYDARAAERAASGDAGARKRWAGHIPKKPRSRWRVLLRLAHTTITDGPLLQKFRGDDPSMFEEFKTRARRAKLWTDDDAVDWPRRAWDAAKHEQAKQIRAKFRRVR